MESPAKKDSDRKLILLVLGFLFGSAVVWGLSMWALKVNIRKTVLLIINDRERLKILEPWAYQAQRHPVSYADALANPNADRSRPVVWEIHVPEKTSEPAYIQGEPAQRIHWLNPEKVEVYNGHGSDERTFTIVGVLRGADKTGVTLQFLGYE